jgi:hypothetical protein
LETIIPQRNIYVNILMKLYTRQGLFSHQEIALEEAIKVFIFLFGLRTGGKIIPGRSECCYGYLYSIRIKRTLLQVSGRGRTDAFPSCLHSQRVRRGRGCATSVTLPIFIPERENGFHSHARVSSIRSEVRFRHPCSLFGSSPDALFLEREREGAEPYPLRSCRCCETRRLARGLPTETGR